MVAVILNNGQLRPRTSNTVSKMNNCLKQAFESAVEQGYIKKNPAKMPNHLV